MHKRTKPAEMINCHCKVDKTGTGPGRMFKANLTNCLCQITEKKGTSPEFKVKRVAVAFEP